MTFERASVFQCIKAAAAYVCIWAVGLACLLRFTGLQLRHIETDLGTTILFGSLAAVAVGIPAFSDKKFRHPAALFFLIASAVVVTMLLYAVAALTFVAYIMLGSINFR